MRTVLTVDHKNKIIHDVKIQRFNTMSNLEKIPEEQASKKRAKNTRITKYKRDHRVLK